MKFQGAGIVVVSLFLATYGLAQNNAPTPTWITATNQPCKIWNPHPEPNESVTWSGPCKDGYASGQGLLRWTVNGKLDAEFEGRYANGKRNGRGVLTTPDGKHMEGEWINDELLTGNGSAI
jgi:hypothetical protein